MTGHDAMFCFRRLNIGWSVNEAATMLNTNTRTIQRWDNGQTPVPHDIWLALDRADMEVTVVTDGLINMIDMCSATGTDIGEPVPITLVMYRTLHDSEQAGQTLATIGIGGHRKAILDAITYGKDVDAAVDIHTVWMNPEHYLQWLGTRATTATLRAEWAGTVSSEGAIAYSLYGSPGGCRDAAGTS